MSFDEKKGFRKYVTKKNVAIGLISTAVIAGVVGVVVATRKKSSPEVIVVADDGHSKSIVMDLKDDSVTIGQRGGRYRGRTSHLRPATTALSRGVATRRAVQPSTSKKVAVVATGKSITKPAITRGVTGAPPGGPAIIQVRSVFKPSATSTSSSAALRIAESLTTATKKKATAAGRDRCPASDREEVVRPPGLTPAESQEQQNGGEKMPGQDGGGILDMLSSGVGTVTSSIAGLLSPSSGEDESVMVVESSKSKSWFGGNDEVTVQLGEKDANGDGVPDRDEAGAGGVENSPLDADSVADDSDLINLPFARGTQYVNGVLTPTKPLIEGNSIISPNGRYGLVQGATGSLFMVRVEEEPGMRTIIWSTDGEIDNKLDEEAKAMDKNNDGIDDAATCKARNAYFSVLGTNGVLTTYYGLVQKQRGGNGGLFGRSSSGYNLKPIGKPFWKSPNVSEGTEKTSDDEDSSTNVHWGLFVDDDSTLAIRAVDNNGVFISESAVWSVKTDKSLST